MCTSGTTRSAVRCPAAAAAAAAHLCAACCNSGTPSWRAKPPSVSAAVKFLGENGKTPAAGHARPSPEVSPLEKFLRHLLANETSPHLTDTVCKADADCAAVGGGGSGGQLCVAGQCVASTSDYHPAFSPALMFDAATGTWVVDPQRCGGGGGS